jgi:SpoVK/Ycf46/Vps4 family AAA+-type ATPase
MGNSSSTPAPAASNATPSAFSEAALLQAPALDVSHTIVTHQTSFRDQAFKAVFLVANIALMNWIFQKMMASVRPSHNKPDRSNIQKRPRQPGEPSAPLVDVRQFLIDKYGSVPALSEHERAVLSMCVLPNAISTSFDDVGGLDAVKRDIYEGMIIPLKHPELYESDGASSLLSAPRGVLLHGPPGTGKTLLAQAIAKECGCCFMHVRMSALQSMWFGESQKIVDAIFNVGELLSPCIIFIDEVDAFLSRRGAVARSSSNDASETMKAEFFERWDGLSTASNTQIVVVGATNRLAAIDEAAIRRFSRSYGVGLPDEAARLEILRRLLKASTLDTGVKLEDIAHKTMSYSGSDLKEMCRYAAQLPMREILHSNVGASKQTPPPATAAPVFDPVSQSFQDSSDDDASDDEPAFQSDFAKRYGALPKRLALLPLQMRDFEAAMTAIPSTVMRTLIANRIAAASGQE